jgi:hypothetical protein
MFPVRYELNIYINMLRNSVFKGLIIVSIGQKLMYHAHLNAVYLICLKLNMFNYG